MASVNLDPVPKSVAALRALAAPSFPLPPSSRVAPVELTTYWVLANVVEYKRQADHDIQVIISDIGDPSQTMIAEFPDTNCDGAADSVDASQMLSARSALIATYGEPSSSHFIPISDRASFVGVGFFDIQHGQVGAAPNAIELHPVLQFAHVTAAVVTPTP